MRTMLIRAVLFALFLLLFMYVVHVNADAVLCAFVATYIIEPLIQDKLK